MRNRRTIVALALAAVALFAVALMMGAARGDFGGTDAAATEAISADGYEPWFRTPFVAPGGEVESGLFALQAGLGGALLGYVLGRARTSRRNTEDHLP